jgi:Tfp pilus assembly protein PilV
MKRCPTCNRTYTDLSLNFCLEDGTPLTTAAPSTPDPNATVRYPPARDTSEPPPTEIYRPAPAVNPRPTAPPPPPQQWSPAPSAAPPRRKSNALWWILGGLAALLVIGVGLVVMIFALASLGSKTNTNTANTRNANRNSNVATNTNTNVNANANIANANANAATPTSFSDDFSDQKWGVGSSDFGRIWYDNAEYHMVSKERTFVVMYAPSDDYRTENATVRVTARSVDGGVPSSGFGLMVHCEQKQRKLEDYALLIYPGEEPAYEIIMHKAGVQSSLVQMTKSDAIRSGSTPNQLEIRIRGNELSFYANGQHLTKITDTANYRGGRAGLYTSDVHEVAFDNLVIDRQLR